MKKIIMICMALMAMSSCKKENNFTLLSEEDAAAIPYQLGQTVKFLNQDNDTVVFQVTYDQTHLSDYNYDHNYGSEVLDFGSPGVYCYTRTVELTSETYPSFISFTVYPEKGMYFNWNNELVISCDLPSSYESLTVGGLNHEFVHREKLYNQYTGELLYDWYYCEEHGLLYFTNVDFSLTRIFDVF